MSYEIIEKHYKHNKDWYVKKIFRRAGSIQNAEDIVQEAYFSVLKYSNKFIPGMDFNAWFYRILGNCLKRYKRMEHSGHDEFGEEHLKNDCVDPMYFEEVHRRIDEAIQKEEREEVREILSLYFIHGFHFREIREISRLSYRNIVFHVTKFRQEVKGDYLE